MARILRADGGARMVRAGLPGFTLIELLTVIGIVGTLAAMLMPVYFRAREMPRRVNCASNLRQIGLAFRMYLADWDDCFPNTGDPYLWMGRRWRWPLGSYLNERLEADSEHPNDPMRSSRTPRILVCSSDATATQQWDSTSYAYSAAFYHDPADVANMTIEDLYKLNRFPCLTQREDAVLHPGQKVLVAEWLSNHTRPAVGWWDWRGARNYLFVDGHVKYLRASQIKRAVNGFPDPNLTVDGIAGEDVE